MLDGRVAWTPETRDQWPEWEAPTDSSRASIGHVLSLLAEQRIHPEMAKAWATHQVVSDGDEVALLAMRRLQDCANVLNPSTYLFTVADYAAWWSEFNDAR